MVVIYNLILVLILPIFICIFCPLSFFIKKWRKGFFRKLGYYSGSALNGGNIVFHCVSVGETLSAIPLIKKFVKENPELIFTVTTNTGWAVANKNLRDTVKAIEFFPFDFPFSVLRFMNFFKPRAVVIVETEIWPNIIYFCRKLKIPVIFINGRISDRSFPKYMYFSRFFKDFLNYPFFLMQTEKDRDRIINIGALPERVFVAGNIKYDLDIKKGKIKREEIGLNNGDMVFIAGSTHAGEEEAMLDGFTALKSEFFNLKMIIAPRHPERFNEVGTLMEKKGISYGRRSRNENIKELFLLDTVGELSGFYELSDFAFVGGSLVNVGGHNILEPASFSKPVLFGKYMQNFREMSGEFLRENAGIEVDAGNFKDILKSLILNEDMRKEYGKKAEMIVEKNKGSIEKTLRLMGQILQK